MLNQNDLMSIEHLRKMRHEISSSVSLVESSIKKLSRSETESDSAKAFRVHAVGTEKLKAVLADIDARISGFSVQDPEKREAE